MEIQKRILPSRRAKNLKIISYRSLAPDEELFSDSDSKETKKQPATGTASLTGTKTKRQPIQRNKNKSAVKPKPKPKPKSKQCETNVGNVGMPTQNIKQEEQLVEEVLLPSSQLDSGGRELEINFEKSNITSKRIGRRPPKPKPKGNSSITVVQIKTGEGSKSSWQSEESDSDDDDDDGSNSSSDSKDDFTGDGDGDSESESESDSDLSDPDRTDEEKDPKNNTEELFPESVVIKVEPSEFAENFPQDSLEESEAVPDQVPFKIIKVDPDDPTAEGKEATWTTPVFTIKAVLTESTKSKRSKSKSKGSSSSKSKSNPSNKEPPKLKRHQFPIRPRRKPESKSRDLPPTMPCPVCHIELQRRKLNDHLLAEHKEVEKPFTCEHCHTKWKSYTTLKKHLVKHLETKPWVCELCDTRFKRDYSLRHHEYYCHTEEGIGNWGEYCAKVNASRKKKSRRSTAHIQQEKGYRIGNKGHRIMPGELPPFKCPEPDCDEEYPTPYTLQRHHASAHQDRPFVCEVCGGTYTTSCQLNVHMAGHTDVRPFVCDQCGATYKSNSHLNLHFRRYHDPKGHEEYKAYRRMIQKRARNRINKLREEEGKEKKTWKKKRSE